MRKKQSELLQYLNTCRTPQKSTEIANALQISPRSVKSYVAQINSLYDKKIILSSRNGYELNHTMYSALFLDGDSDALPQTSEERAFYIIKQLVLAHSSHLDLFDLCDYLCVSYSTIKADISKMNKTFGAYNVRFACEHDCVKVLGEEQAKRKLIRYVISEESTTSFIDLNHLKEYFQADHVDRLRRLVTQTFQDHHYYLNDFASVNLLLHLLIILNRKSCDSPEAVSALPVNDCFRPRPAEPPFKPLSDGDDPRPLPGDDDSEQKLIKDLCRRLEEEFRLCLDRVSQEEIHMLVKANASYSLPDAREELRSLIGDEVMELTEYYIRQVNSLYIIDLSDDAFVTPFSLHLKNLIFRARNHSFVQNPLAESIRTGNPIIFDVAIYIGLDLMERLGVMIPEDEMAFLALHVGSELARQNLNRTKAPVAVLCPEYRGLHNNLLNSLLLDFGNQIHIVQSVHREEDLMSLSGCSILFTTVPLRESYDCYVVTLSPFALDSQYDLIQDALAHTRNRYVNEKLRKNFHQFFEKGLFLLNPPLEGRSQVLSQLCQALQELNYVDENFLDNVYRREHAATTAFANIAIPHAVEMDAIKTSVAVAVSRKGFQWDGHTVYLVLLLAINKADKKIFRELYESLISLFSEDSILQEVRACGGFKDFEKIIYTHIRD
ncbi:MAG: PTS transporter subunit EIIA [Lachnospiraceae bacterium]|nr:PTS transporter subunit EIIA [Lachnospiraceae bacterium]